MSEYLSHCLQASYPAKTRLHHCASTGGTCNVMRNSKVSLFKSRWVLMYLCQTYSYFWKKKFWDILEIFQCGNLPGVYGNLHTFMVIILKIGDMFVYIYIYCILNIYTCIFFGHYMHAILYRFLKKNYFIFLFDLIAIGILNLSEVKYIHKWDVLALLFRISV